MRRLGKLLLLLTGQYRCLILKLSIHMGSITINLSELRHGKGRIHAVAGGAWLAGAAARNGAGCWR